VHREPSCERRLTGLPAEEIEDASLTLPKAIIWSVAPNAALGLLMIVTLAFTAGDIPSILKSATGEPFIQIFYNATQSRVGATVMTAIIVVLLCSCCFSEVATASRQLWSFSRDRGFPGSSWLSVVSGTSDRVNCFVHSFSL
jgi:choline transport protein